MNISASNENAVRHWHSVALCAAASLCLGVLLGFASAALKPAKEFTELPDTTAKDAEPLPDVYWLNQYSSGSSGSVSEKTREIAARKPVSITDREIAAWLDAHFTQSDAPIEDIELRRGIPHVRIGGRRPGAAKDPTLIVSIPNRLKISSLVDSALRLQFRVTPQVEGGVQMWDIDDASFGSARIPDFIAEPLAKRIAARYFAISTEASEMRDRLASYAEASVSEGKLNFAAKGPN